MHNHSSCIIMDAKKLNGSILEIIGNTPMVRINRMNPNPNVEIFAKLEGFNPTGSIKDRIALKMIEQAEAEGMLETGKTIIEPTSGNTGIALAMISVLKGYEVEIVMSSAVSIERQRMIKAFGAKVTLTDPSKGTDGAILKAKEQVQAFPDKYFMPDQFSNHYNKLTHYSHTAQEIYDQMDGQVDYFVSSIGTSGTVMGVGMGLKEKDPNVKIVCAEPVKGHYIQGLKNMEEAVVPSIFDPSTLDEVIMVESEDAFEVARNLVVKEGLFVGMSSGAAMYAAIQLANRIESGRIAVIFPDRGEKYLSTDLFRGLIND